MPHAALFARMISRAQRLGLALALLSASSAHALSGAGFELGHGNGSTEAARISARWDWDTRWALGKGWIASGYWEAGVGLLQGDGAGAQTLADLGFTPVFRLRSGVSRFFFEGGIGAHFLSRTHLNNGIDLGSSFQFGDHIGFGWNFGEKDAYEVGYRLQRLSNADLAESNDGLNLHLIRLGYNY
jgi:lipid A 3-O-deacylase